MVNDHSFIADHRTGRVAGICFGVAVASASNEADYVFAAWLFTVKWSGRFSLWGLAFSADVVDFRFAVRFRFVRFTRDFGAFAVRL